jgi:hypothetical protein
VDGAPTDSEEVFEVVNVEYTIKIMYRGGVKNRPVLCLKIDQFFV